MLLDTDLKEPTELDIKKAIEYIKKETNTFYELALVSDYVKNLITVINYAESKINEELPKNDKQNDDKIEVLVATLSNHDEVKNFFKEMFGDI